MSAGAAIRPAMRLSPILASLGLRRRHALFPVIALGHILLLTLIWLIPRGPTSAPSMGGRLSVFEAKEQKQPSPKPAEPERPRASPVAQKSPVVPALAVPVVDPNLPASDTPAAPIFDSSAAEQAGFGTTCDVAATLTAAFNNDAALRAQLDRIGPASRSVANAIMIWDGSWVPLKEDAPEDALFTLRSAVVEAVRAAPGECFAEDVAGPRFVFVTQDGRSTILVLGSATWRLDQLLTQEPTRPGEAAPQ
jgi:hypothetical protein